MSILGNLLGMSRRRSYGGNMWSRSGYGRGRGSFYGGGYSRSRAPSIFGGSLGRMAMGGVAAMLTRSFLSRRHRYD